MNTHLLWEAQEEPLSDNGHFYDGHGWYRGEFDIPKEFDGKEISFYCGGGMNEVWLWVNGRYVYHHPLAIWWWGSHKFDVDVTEFLEPGQTNTIAIRVWNKAELGGLYRRGFFWSPNAAVGEE